jgi:transcriptional regulator with XRE-family HTH domain
LPEIVAEILARSGLSQAELGRRAGMPRSVVNAYARGARRPGEDALVALATAGGFAIELVPRRAPVYPRRAAWMLEQVLDLAEALPYAPSSDGPIQPRAFESTSGEESR